MAKATLRCAIYTRKSSEEGLEQPFNSLHAQRRACDNYVQSQAGEGWDLLPLHYDDGGYSGGDLKRPALQRMLTDIQAGTIDIVVVYKVDRLTRSLGDFAKLVEILDKHRVSFVSVTQAFNTTSSMGRLTLNILLSFAQFEREITGERIRDKIAASKARGMWMGGQTPLGYETGVAGRGVLSINEEEAETVRVIFERFIALRSLGRLSRRLDADGFRSRRRAMRSGRIVGGIQFDVSYLCRLLQNRIYLGEIVHKGTVHPGLHPPIVDVETFEAAQALLADRRVRNRSRVTLAQRTLLNGLIHDCEGGPMRPVFGKKGAQRYSYYAATPLPGRQGDKDGAIRRVPTFALDELVIARISKLTGVDETACAATTVRSIISRVEVLPTSVKLVLRTRAVAALDKQRSPIELIRDRLSPADEARVDPANANFISITVPVRLVVRGGRSWPKAPRGHAGPIVGVPNPELVKNLRAAHEVLQRCNIETDGFDRALLRKTCAPKNGRDRKIIRLAFLAPDIQQAILAGEPLSYPQGDIPASWAKQRSLFGLASCAP